MNRLKAALEQLDEAIDALEQASELREARRARREAELQRQSVQNEARANKQRAVEQSVARRLDDAIERIETILQQ